MSKDSVKTQIDTDITNKTTSKSISPLNVGSNMKAIIDLIPEGSNITKTNGSVVAINGSKATLQYDINTVNKSGGSEVKLPTTTEVGKEVLFLASNYAGTVSVYVNDAEDVKLSGGINGISGSQGNLQINANEAYRFISLNNSYWYFEKIIDIPTNLYQLVSERSTDGTLASNSNFKYPTEKAVKTYVDANSGGTPQDLQSVIDVGGYAEKDGGNSYIFFIDDGGIEFAVFISDGLGNIGQVSINQNGFGLRYDSPTTGAYINASADGGLNFTNKVGAFTTYVDFIDASINTVIQYPAKTITGNYTINTTPNTIYTVATLPSAVLNDMAIVSDATAPTYLGTLVGGGSVVTPVWHNGTIWVSR